MTTKAEMKQELMAEIESKFITNLDVATAYWHITELLDQLVGNGSGTGPSEDAIVAAVDMIDYQLGSRADEWTKKWLGMLQERAVGDQS